MGGIMSGSASTRAVRLGLALVAACSSERSSDAPSRGAGLRPATLSAAEQGTAYASALRATFEIQPNLVLLLDPALLPSARGGTSTHDLSPDVIGRMRSAGVIQGTCQPSRRAARASPVCAAERAGYVIRVSDIFRLAADTVQRYLTAERFRAARDTSGYQPPFQFEQRHQLVRRDDAWVVSKQERLVK
jgi:hypothetical protein